MRTLFLYLVVCLVFGSMVVACGGQPEVPQCQQDTDCASGESCVAQQCQKKATSPIATPLTYTIKQKCADVPMQEQQSWKKLEVSTDGDKVNITHFLVTHCEADLSFSLDTQGSTLKITESNSAPLTRCTCGYELSMQIKNLASGAYKVEVWGVKSKNIEAKKLGEQDVTVK